MSTHLDLISDPPPFTNRTHADLTRELERAYAAHASLEDATARVYGDADMMRGSCGEAVLICDTQLRDLDMPIPYRDAFRQIRRLASSVEGQVTR